MRLLRRDPLECLLKRIFGIFARASSGCYGKLLACRRARFDGQHVEPPSGTGEPADMRVGQLPCAPRTTVHAFLNIIRLICTYSCSGLAILAVALFSFASTDRYLLLTNGVSAFFEGAFGFGGSLVFLACNVEHLGWGGSVLLDCILASINLSYVVLLNLPDLKYKQWRSVLVQYCIAIIGLGVGLYYFREAQDDIQRVLPFLAFGMLACLYKVFHILAPGLVAPKDPRKGQTAVQKVFSVLAGFGVGSTNLEAPLTDMLFRRRTGLVSAFIVALLVAKIGLFLSLGIETQQEVIDPSMILCLGLFAFAFTKVGAIFAAELKKVEHGTKIAEVLKSVVVVVALVHLLRLALTSLMV